MKKLSRKATVASGVVGSVLAATAAFAFWTTGGSGTGAASTTAGVVNAITVHQAGTPLSAMYPGDSPQPLTFTLQNTSTTQSVHVNSVGVTVATNKDGCTAADFIIVPPVDVVVAREVAANSTSAAITSGSIQFNNKLDTDQNACKAADVTLTYTAS